jgi:hypothetical protein
VLKSKIGFESDVELQKMTTELDNIKQFMKSASRIDILPFLNKLKKLVTQCVEKNSKYQDVDEQNLICANQELISSCGPFNKSFETTRSSSSNDPECEPVGFTYVSTLSKRKEDLGYLSFDMSSANFASLKLILGIDEQWSDFLASIVPSDERGDSSRNKIEDWNYNNYSKYFLLF